jgi:hypothetical protein
MSYVTVFEITREAIPLWFPVSFVFFGVWGTVMLSQSRNLGPSIKFARGVVLFFACLWVAAASLYFLNRRHDVEAYRNGSYKIAEGPVEHYQWQGKHECFTVRSIDFCHGTANPFGWVPPFRLGPASWPVGLTREGLAVRVAYSDDPVPLEKSAFPLVLRLDVVDAAGPECRI